MATLANARAQAPAVPQLGIGYDWLVVAAAFWLGAGLYWDGWAHGYGLPDSFWTIWHAAFYSGFAASAVVIAAPLILGRSRTASWRDIAAWRAAIRRATSARSSAWRSSASAACST